MDTRPVANVLEPLKLTAVERIDLLLAIDNSGSMGDKQEILARAVPDLVRRLANPRCVDAGGVPVEDQPSGATDPCPVGSEREFLAVPDIHIGIVSSSLGGPPGLLCANAGDDDKGHLISRGEDGTAVPTYGNKGFLAWDPNEELSPPGESVLEAGEKGLIPAFQEMVRGVGEQGCGFEAQLESWYRFLIEPQPYAALARKGDDVLPQGTDATILAQRKAFLRPDSLVAIVMLSDENDCSIALGKGAAKVYDTTRSMVKARPECAKNPNDACCAPCDEAPAECAPKAECKDENGEWARLEEKDDNANLRCFDQKRRFGKSYLYPTSRYVKGLTEMQVPDRSGKMVPNPLFVDLDPDDDITGTRPASLVFLAGIVGVPWQDIARDPTTLVKGLKSAKELAQLDTQGKSTWDLILGDPENGKLPLDPHMHETTDERGGAHPITGQSLAPSTAGALADPISGHEMPKGGDAPQFACIFPLLEPFECVGQSCDCQKPANNPLCLSPSGEYTKTQYHAKAYPGLRELSVLKEIGDQAIVASVCPANMDETTETDASTENDAPDFGYRPAIGALIDQLKGKLGHQCLPRALTPDDSGQVRCLVIEARETEKEICSCKAEDGRTLVTEDHAPAVADALGKGVIKAESNCFCEIPQLVGEELSACQTKKEDPIVIDGDQVDGFCYIDASSVPPIGNKALVPESCTDTEQRLIRLVGNAKARPGSSLFIMCSDSGGQ